MSIATIRSAIATAVDAITGVRSTAYVPDQITGDAHAVVGRGVVDYDLTFDDEGAYRSGGVIKFPVTVFRARAAEKQAQIFLDSLCEPVGTGSLKVAIEDNVALATAAGRGYAHVKSVSEITAVDVGGGQFLAVEFDVEVVV